jgi:hypothetical protein
MKPETVKDIINEVREMEKLCNGTHPNIIKLLDHGHLPLEFYFIDVEWCHLSLQEYMRGEKRVDDRVKAGNVYRKG